jgi:hypothetical protein
MKTIRCVAKVMRLVLYIRKVIGKCLHFNMIPFKVVPFGSNTLLELILPCLEVLLEVFFHEVLQSVSYSSQDVVNCPALMSSWVVCDLQE